MCYRSSDKLHSMTAEGKSEGVRERGREEGSRDGLHKMHQFYVDPLISNHMILLTLPNTRESRNQIRNS